MIYLFFIKIESVYCRLRYRFKRLSQERRSLCFLLVLYAIIMWALLLSIFLLARAFQGDIIVCNILRQLNSCTLYIGRPITLYEKVTTTDSIINQGSNSN